MKKSKLFNLGFQDFIKGLVMAVLTPILVILKQSFEAGTLTFNWQTIGLAAASGALAYLLKQFVTNSDGNILAKEEEIGGGGIKNPPKP